MDTTTKNILSKMQEIGGLSSVSTVVQDAQFENDCVALEERGVLIEPTTIKMMKGQDGQCHLNCALLFEANKNMKNLHIMTGYALLNGCWYEHSWLVKPSRSDVVNVDLKSPDKWRVVETTLKREKYLGVILPHGTETEDFIRGEID